MEEWVKKLNNDVEKLTQHIQDIDKKLEEKYQGYPESTVILHQYDVKSKMDWELYFTIVANSNVKEDWETIKTMYMLKLNAKREYAFEVSNMKSKTIGCQTKNIKFCFNEIVSKTDDINLLKKHGDDIIIWGIQCKNPKEECNLPDDLIFVLTQMEIILKKQYNIQLIENLHMASLHMANMPEANMPEANMPEANMPEANMPEARK